MRITHLLAAAAAAGSLALAGCGEDVADAVDDTVGVTEAIAERTDGGRVSDLEIRGDAATATVTRKGDGAQEVTLAKRDGTWEVTKVAG